MLPHAVGISNSYEPSGENAVMGRKQQTVFGRPEIEEDLGGLRLGVSAPSFFQVNSAMVGRIFEHMRPLVQPGRRIVDLYCGAGTFSLFFAACGAEVVGVEENGGAVREARANAERNALSGKTSFVAGKVENVRQAGSPAAAAIERADVVFLDPPRKGSDEGTLAAIAAAEVPEVWYLSCNPSTLARDLALLVAAGYVLGAVQPFDMFPQTGHVEALALLRRAVPAAPKAG
jgi:23S rRNA (uracil1939-C5)-methyltransferase